MNIIQKIFILKDDEQLNMLQIGFKIFILLSNLNILQDNAKLKLAGFNDDSDLIRQDQLKSYDSIYKSINNTHLNTNPHDDEQ